MKYLPECQKDTFPTGKHIGTHGYRLAPWQCTSSLKISISSRTVRSLLVKFPSRRTDTLVLHSQSMPNRARWYYSSDPQIQNHDPHFNVKFNSEAGLFSSTFWFWRIFCCQTALFVSCPWSRKNGPKTAWNELNFKIGWKPNQKL